MAGLSFVAGVVTSVCVGDLEVVVVKEMGEVAGSGKGEHAHVTDLDTDTKILLSIPPQVVGREGEVLELTQDCSVSVGNDSPSGLGQQ